MSRFWAVLTFSWPFPAFFCGDALGCSRWCSFQCVCGPGPHFSDCPLTGPVAVAQVLFHEPFLERCKQLIAASLSMACSSIQTPLAAALEAAAAHDPEAAGHLQPGSWPSVATGTAADAAAAAAAVGVLERAGSLWASAGALSPKYSGVIRAMSLHPSGPLRDDLGTAGEVL
jgi:hypothetical protein